jgi:hypothetical protein
VPDNPDVAVIELDSENGLGDQHRDDLVRMDAAEGHLLTDDHDHVSVADLALNQDRLD